MGLASVDKEPKVDGYLHGQLWNRPVSDSGKWIIFRIIQPEVPTAINWLDGVVTTPHPPAIYIGSSDPGNIRPFSLLKCDVYTGDPPPAPRPSETGINRRFLPANGLGTIAPQSVLWEEAASVFLGGVSVATIGINTKGVSARYLYFDFLGEFYKSALAIYNPGEMIPKGSRMLIYTADEFPLEAAVDWDNLVSAPAGATPIARARLSCTGIWLTNGLVVAVSGGYNYFSTSGLLFAADTADLSSSRFVREIFDADSTVIPNRNSTGQDWNGTLSSDGRGALFHWNPEAADWEGTT